MRERGAAASWAGHVRPNEACPTDAFPIALLDQRSNHAQEFLLLWSVASRDEKGSDLNVRDLST
jgi:hypothetical protein